MENAIDLLKIGFFSTNLDGFLFEIAVFSFLH